MGTINLTIAQIANLSASRKTDRVSLNFEIHGVGAYNLKGHESVRGCICQNLKAVNDNPTTMRSSLG